MGAVRTEKRVAGRSGGAFRTASRRSSSNNARRPSWRGSTHSTQILKARSGPPAIYESRRKNIEPRDARRDLGAEREGKPVLGGREFTPRESPSFFGRSSATQLILCLDKVCAGTARARHRYRERPTG